MKKNERAEIRGVRIANFCSGRNRTGWKFLFRRIIAGIFPLFTSDKTHRDNISEKYQSNFRLYLSYAFLRNTNDIITSLFLSDNMNVFAS